MSANAIVAYALSETDRSSPAPTRTVSFRPRSPGATAAVPVRVPGAPVQRDPACLELTGWTGLRRRPAQRRPP
ncbi:hypothetical protein ACFY64_15270 [Streptomyces collinus]|uniref:hypothetical protein n=1 Tax=Streptomyces collinus TaxID=42684 RepID=UPI003683D2EC